MSENNSTNVESNARSWIWPMIVVSLLLLQIVISGSAAYFALSDPSVAIEPDYHNKAINWDARLARRDLEWNADINVPSTSDSIDQHEVTITLTDKEGQTLTGAQMEVTAFPHARANQRQVVKFHDEDKSGRYRATMRLPRAGIWEFRVFAKHNDSVFLQSHELEVDKL